MKYSAQRKKNEIQKLFLKKLIILLFLFPFRRIISFSRKTIKLKIKLDKYFIYNVGH